LEEDHWAQPGNLFRKMTPEQNQFLFENTTRAIDGASQDVLDRHVANCRRADPTYVDGVSRALKHTLFETRLHHGPGKTGDNHGKGLDYWSMEWFWT
jgi:catalase